MAPDTIQGEEVLESKVDQEVGQSHVTFQIKDIQQESVGRYYTEER